MFCAKCGVENINSTKFCSGCGAAITQQISSFSSFVASSNPFMHYVNGVFQKYAVFNGKTTRSEFWYFMLFNIIIMYTLLFLSMELFNNQILYLIYVIAMMIPCLAITARRLHDTNRSGWWMLLYFTLIGSILLMVWYCQKSIIDSDKTIA